MAELTVAILGLDRLGVSIALRLKAYMSNGGQHQFKIVGYDNRDDYEKPARKQSAIDKIERKPFDAVRDADVVVMNLPYEDIKSGYELLKDDLRDGVVILDTSVLKQPSLAWAKKYLTEEHHVIGFTPIINSAYMLDVSLKTEDASDDYFHNSTIYLTPSVSSIKEAIDLAVNFAIILDATPHFLDPAEHDSLTTITEAIPQVMSVAAYYNAMKRNAWQDTQRLTNPPFNVLTRYLLTHHPDALRDGWIENSENLTRAIDEIIATLTAVRDRIEEKDTAGVEAFLIEASDDYQTWINKRNTDTWEEKPHTDVKVETSITDSLFGSSITKRLFGNKNDKN